MKISRFLTFSLTAIALSFGVSLMAQTPDSTADLHIKVVEDGEYLSICPEVENSGELPQEYSYSISVKKSGASGNTSNTSQSGKLTVDPGSLGTGSVSRINFSPGDMLEIEAELHASDGRLLAASTLSRKL